jgi:hypothetical protein
MREESSRGAVAAVHELGELAAAAMVHLSTSAHTEERGRREWREGRVEGVVVHLRHVVA